jgi:hypothetical protein
MAVGGASTLWGGCNVWFSPDNLNYQLLGSIHGGARYGHLTAALAAHADPDAANTLKVLLRDARQTLLGGTQDDADQMRTLIYVDGEIMAYQSATLTGPGAYDLTYLRRGQYGSIAAAHLANKDFVRLDQAIFKAPFDAGLAGTKVYFKFQSFNIWGGGGEELSALKVYSHQLNAANLIAAPIEGSPGDIVAVGSDGQVTTKAIPSNLLVSLGRFQLDATNGYRAIQFDAQHADWSGSGNGYRFKLDCDIVNPTNAMTVTVTVGLYVNNTWSTHLDLWQSVTPSIPAGEHHGLELDFTTLMEPGHLISIAGAGLLTNNTDYASSGGTPGKGELGSENIVAAPVIRLDQYDAESLVASYDFETFYVDFAFSAAGGVAKGVQQVEFLAGASTVANGGEITVTITADGAGAPLNIESLMTAAQLSLWRSGRANLTIDTDLSGNPDTWYAFDGDATNASALTIPIHGNGLLITLKSAHLMLSGRGGDGGEGGWNGHDPGPGEDGGHAIHLTGTGSATLYLYNQDSADGTIGQIFPGGPGASGGWQASGQSTGGGGGGAGYFNAGQGGLGRNWDGTAYTAGNGFDGPDYLSDDSYGMFGGGLGGLGTGKLVGGCGGGNDPRFSPHVEAYRKPGPPGSPDDTVEYTSLSPLQSYSSSTNGAIRYKELALTEAAADFGAQRFVSFSLPSAHKAAHLYLSEYWPLPPDVAAELGGSWAGRRFDFGDVNLPGWTAAVTSDGRDTTLDYPWPMQNLYSAISIESGYPGTSIQWVPTSSTGPDTFDSQISIGLVTPAHESNAVCGKAVKRDAGIGGSTTLVSGDSYFWVRGEFE